MVRVTTPTLRCRGSTRLSRTPCRFQSICYSQIASSHKGGLRMPLDPGRFPQILPVSNFLPHRREYPSACTERRNACSLLVQGVEEGGTRQT